MAGDWITIDGLSSLDGMIRWVGDMEQVLHRPVVFAPIIHSFGRGIKRNFDSEVTPNGRSWQRLAPFTQDTREDRGYPRDHPVMDQSGQLRSMAVDPFMKWQDHARNSQRNAIAPYGNFEPLSMNASVNNGTFRANISGSRVQNQYGGSMRWRGKKWGTRDRQRASALPSRPFWGLTQEMFNEGVPTMMTVFMREWREAAVGVWSI